jgi:hypothetical protein
MYVILSINVLKIRFVRRESNPIATLDVEMVVRQDIARISRGLVLKMSMMNLKWIIRLIL